MINAELIEKMKNLGKTSKEKGRVVKANEAFEKYPPEGSWHKDKEGRIILEENEHDLWRLWNRRYCFGWQL